MRAFESRRRLWKLWTHPFDRTSDVSRHLCCPYLAHMAGLYSICNWCRHVSETVWVDERTHPVDVTWRPGRREKDIHI